jgi:hypothetical protein
LNQFILRQGEAHSPWTKVLVPGGKIGGESDTNEDMVSGSSLWTTILPTIDDVSGLRGVGTSGSITYRMRISREHLD